MFMLVEAAVLMRVIVCVGEGQWQKGKWQGEYQFAHGSGSAWRKTLLYNLARKNGKLFPVTPGVGAWCTAARSIQRLIEFAPV
jgi:hypothetical protein